MYNGIGLQTPRGSGTSGHVQKNRGYVPPHRVRNETSMVSGRGGPNDTFKAAVMAKANQDLMEHKVSGRASEPGQRRDACVAPDPSSLAPG